ncbi:MAG: hypothetical protein M1812_005304 [Candelaria pacifica]|nr:MAG: hypothetical protein M1812_005304 [Candelaria pacifica]
MLLLTVFFPASLLAASRYSPSFQYSNPAPTVIGWSIPEDSDTGYISPTSFSGPDIICHKGATPGGTHATVAAGSSIDLQWTIWPESHHGPVITYLANCNGPCESVEKTQLQFFKIAEAGLIDDSTFPGKWASDQMIANNNTATAIIPSDIAPGNYVLRHEIIALHAANEVNGAQNYPQCINLEITGTGTDNPSGVLGEALYTPNDPGIFINIYQKISEYTIPGPPLYSGSTDGSTLNTTTKAQSPASVNKLALHYANDTDSKLDLPSGAHNSSLTPSSSSSTLQHTSSTSLSASPASSSSPAQEIPPAGSEGASPPISPQPTSSCSHTSTVTITVTPTVTVTIASTSSSPLTSTKAPCHRRRRRGS